MKKVLLGVLVVLANLAAAAPEATYYRVWQGYQRSDITAGEFQGALPEFMKWTVRLYGDALNEYIVAIPPTEKPSVIPDEFALIALRDEASYKAIRATDDGKAYGEAHWQLFAREVSKSAPLERRDGLQRPAPQPLASGTAYDMINAPVNWHGGYTVFFLGLRKSPLSPKKFLERLGDHVSYVSQGFGAMGLKGYIAIAHEDYEAAYMNWESKDAADKAFATEIGAAVREDAEELMTFLQFAELRPFNGIKVIPGEAYSTVR